MANAEELESEEAGSLGHVSELDVITNSDDDDKDMVFSVKDSQDLLELHCVDDNTSAEQSTRDCADLKADDSKCGELIGDMPSLVIDASLAKKHQPGDQFDIDVATLEQASQFIDGQAIQFPDGTMAVIKNFSQFSNSLQMVNLEDGTVAWLATDLLATDSDQLGLDSIDVQVDEDMMDDESKVSVMEELSSSGIDCCPTSDDTAADLLSADGNVLFSRLVKTRQMMQSGSTSEKAYKCPYDGCERFYTTQHHLKVHQRSHTGDRPFQCDFEGCGKAFATGYGLKSHRRIHTGEKPYTCSLDSCDKAFKTSGDLQKHIRIHTGERPFVCPYPGCGHSFTTSNIRKVHIRTHTGERPYACDIPGCGKTFASATNYKNHIRIHSGEKPYVCTSEGCGKRFTEYSSLYKHHVVHTHKKPYQCADCGKTYRQTSTLAMHRRMAHSDNGNETSLLSPSFIVSNTTIDQVPNDDPLVNKKPMISLRFVDDTLRSVDDTDGNLIIDTDSHQLTCCNDSISTVMSSTVVPASSVYEQLSSAIGIPVHQDIGSNQVYVIADQSQFDALQRIAQQQQQ